MEAFKTISIRGRMAFGIHCLRRAFTELGYRQPILQSIIERFAEFLESTEIHIWDTKANEITPLVILDNHPDSDAELYTTLSVEEVQELRTLYQTMPTEVADLIDYVYQIGETNLYSGTGKYSEATYEKLINVVDLMKELGLSYPNTDPYRISPFTELDGWGNARPLSDFE